MRVPLWASRLPMGCVALVVLLASAACQPPSPDEAVGRMDRGSLARAATPSCDSAQAARVALDSLAQLDPFPSAVYRFESDSLGVRIVTWPTSGQLVLDGMAVVRIDRACRIVSLIQTDSA